jgi:Lysyl oxidase
MGMQQWPAATRGPALAVMAAALSAAMLGTAATASAEAPPPAGSATAAASAGPQMKLIATEKTVKVGKFGSMVFVDPDIYLASLRSAFQVNVSRSSYTRPIVATQVIRAASGTIRRSLPSWALADRWQGIRHFFQVTIRNARGRVVGRSKLVFCPDGYILAKATPDSAATDPFPGQCYSGDPFGLGEVWGLPRGWAVDSGGASYRLPIGTYKLTEAIAPQYVRLFGISRRSATATVKVKVVSYKNCCGPAICCQTPATKAPAPAGFTRVERAAGARHGGPGQPSTALLKRVPEDALPDLIPLPSWGITVSNPRKTASAFLDFGATVWISGNSPLDVEGFRVPGTGRMLAYQYFYKNGSKLIGRMRVGTMGFSGYNAWHFNQFAQYFLLNKHKRVVVRSRKVGFCIAPTDNVDMTLRHATWQPSYTGIAGNCGDPAALWATEILPIGWGDTYVQTVPYQSFDITKIPNGIYYIEIVANPKHLLKETSMSNDVSLREVIISGRAGHRKVRVPAWHGIDKENGSGGGYDF